MDDTDRKLIALLQANGREPTSSLARKLGLSRSTVQDRLLRLEEQKVIGGYTLRFNEDYDRRLIRAHVMISINPKFADRVAHTLKQMLAVKALYAVSGQYDLIAILEAESTQDIDRSLDEIGRIAGIEKTMSSIVLSTKLER
jgi:DNA-binding Lrp family transcriptional regulator